MIRTYSPEEVAAAHLPDEWTDRVRWLKRRLASGEIPGKRISRGVWRMTDADIEVWLAKRSEVVEEEQPAPFSVIEGLSSRSRAKRAS